LFENTDLEHMIVKAEVSSRRSSPLEERIIINLISGHFNQFIITDRLDDEDVGRPLEAPQVSLHHDRQRMVLVEEEMMSESEGTESENEEIEYYSEGQARYIAF
jgi:hypothetical protein